MAGLLKGSTYLHSILCAMFQTQAEKIKSSTSSLPSLPSRIPSLKALGITCRSVNLQWLTDKDDWKTQYAKGLFQITKAELDILKFEVVYEGDESTFEVMNLKPNTLYRFILRFADRRETPLIWSQEKSEIEVKTDDETLLNKTVTQIIRSIQESDSAKVKSILDEFGSQISAETTDKTGRTLLMIACQLGDLEIVKALVQHGASITATTMAGKTPLSMAITGGHFPIVHYLLSSNTALSGAKDSSGSTLLMLASETASVCYKKGFHTSIIELLLKLGLNVNEEDPYGHTALDRLMMTSGHYEAAQVLIRSGARIIETVDKRHPLTTLMTAALNGHTEVAKLLMYQYQQDPRLTNEVM
jgi:ankyrin repeat protein